jgi:hypothetical protein
VTDDARKPEPAWITRLARESAAAEGMRRHKSKGTFGPASEGRQLMAWTCLCGWHGTSRELKAGPDGLACPLCGGAVQPK